jgi:outer membrane protein with beta-barrel domain
MNKVITTAAVILCLAGSARAGDAKTGHRSTALAGSTHQVLLGVEIESALPISSAYSDVSGPGAGALLTIEYPVMEQLSVTGRAGFQYHLNKSPAPGFDSHIHAIPVLLGAKYYVMQNDRQGLFASAEVGTFGLMAGVSTPGGSGSDTQLKFGAGVGAGYQWKEWSFRLNAHAQDVGNFGDLMMVTAGVGYQFAGF